MGAIDAAFVLIHSCIQNNEFADAHLYASTLYEIINHKHDNKIPEDQRQRYIAEGACFLAQAKLRLAMGGNIPPEEKQKAGQEAIALARRALEIHTQLEGTGSENVAIGMGALADVLAYFHDDEDEEILRLFEQSKAIFARLQGCSSLNVAKSDEKLGNSYYNRAVIARAANDLDRCKANLVLALPRYRDAARIYQAFNYTDDADTSAKKVMDIEIKLAYMTVTRGRDCASADTLDPAMILPILDQLILDRDGRDGSKKS